MYCRTQDNRGQRTAAQDHFKELRIPGQILPEGYGFCTEESKASGAGTNAVNISSCFIVALAGSKEVIHSCRVLNTICDMRPGADILPQASSNMNIW